MMHQRRPLIHLTQLFFKKISIIKELKLKEKELKT